MTTMSDYALLSLAGYPRQAANAGPLPQGWIPYMESIDPDSDFAAFAFYNPSTHEVVISYAGTDQIPDLQNLSLSEIERVKEDWLLANLPAATGVYSPQVWQAIKFYADVRAQLALDPEIPDSSPITLVGHSLGGGLASIVAVLFDQPARTFDEAPFQYSVHFDPLLERPSFEGWRTSRTVSRYFQEYQQYQQSLGRIGSSSYPCSAVCFAERALCRDQACCRQAETRQLGGRAASRTAA